MSRALRARAAARRHDQRRARRGLAEARPARAPARPGGLRPAQPDQADLRPEEPAEPRQEEVTLRQSFDALRERQFRLLFTGQIVSLFGDALTGVALAFAVLDLGSATDLGYVFAAKTVPLVGFLLIGGVFADRLPR